MAERLGVHVDPVENDGRPMEVIVKALDYGWEITFSPAPAGEARLFDFTGKEVNSAYWDDGSRMRLTLNIADWGITPDMVKDLIDDLATDSTDESTTSDSS